jgi:hypothetical protein
MRGAAAGPAIVRASAPRSAPPPVRHEAVTYETFYGLNEKPFSVSTDPKFLYGFHIDSTFQDFSFNMFWQGQVGGLVYNAWKNYQFPANNTGANFSTQALGAWSPTNTGSTVPAPTLNSVLLPAM